MQVISRKWARADSFGHIIELAYEGVWTVDADGRTDYINERGAAILGYTPDEMVGRPPADFGVPGKTDESMMSTIQRSKVNQIECCMRHRNGSVVWSLGSTQPLYDEDGDYEGAIALFIDITERKRAEEALKKSEERFRTLVTASPDVIFTVTPDWEEVTRFRREDGIVFEDRRRLAWEDRHLSREEHTEFRTELERATGAKDTFELEHRIRLSDGRVRWFLTRAVPILDAEGSITEWFGTGKDITQRKEAEAALSKSEQRFQLLSEANSILLSSREPEAVIQSIAGKVVRHLDCDVFFNYILDELQNGLRLNAYYGISRRAAREIERLELGASICGCVARDGEAVVCENIQLGDDSQASLVRALGMQAFACYPIRVGPLTVGTLSFGTRSRPKFEEDELALMRIVAEQVSVSIKRRRAEVAVKEREEHFARAQRIAHMGSFSWDIRRDILYLSDEAYRISGLRPGAPTHYSTILSLTHPEDVEKVEKAVRDGLESGTYEFDYRIVREDGEERYVEGQGIVTFDADRRPSKMVGTVHDVTEHKRAEKKLGEAQKRYQDLIEANVDFVWEVDAQGRYTYCSPHMERLWGLKPEEMLGKTPFDMMLPPMRDDIVRQFTEMAKEPMAFKGLRSLSHDVNGRTICLETSGVPFFDDNGTLLGYRGVTRDVTELSERGSQSKEATIPPRRSAPGPP